MKSNSVRTNWYQARKRFQKYLLSLNWSLRSGTKYRFASGAQKENPGLTIGLLANRKVSKELAALDELVRSSKLKQNFFEILVIPYGHLRSVKDQSAISENSNSRFVMPSGKPAANWASAANALLNESKTSKVLILSQDVSLTSTGLIALLRNSDSGDPVVIQPLIADKFGLLENSGLVQRKFSFVIKDWLRKADPSEVAPKSLVAIRASDSTTLLVDSSKFRGFKLHHDAHKSVMSTTSKLAHKMPSSVAVCNEVVATDSRDSQIGAKGRSYLGWLSPAGALTAEKFLALSKFGLSLNGDLKYLGVQRRLSIKNPATSGLESQKWGDTYFANDLKSAFEKLGYFVVVDTSSNFYRRKTTQLDDVTLTIRGLVEFVPPKNKLNLIWVISHPDLVRAEELDKFDLAFAASSIWSEKMSKTTNKPVTTLLQATNPDRFNSKVSVDPKFKILFVGGSRGGNREVVQFAVDAKCELAVIGGGWSGHIPEKAIVSEFITNDQLPEFYASADVVLNDHWGDMKSEGFINNRVFDAAALGVRVLSDFQPDLDKIFGGLVQTYYESADFAELVNDLGRWPNEAGLAKIAQEIQRNHSFLSRAIKMDELISKNLGANN